MLLLDNHQQKIVDAKEPNICVIAGAGSGKTTTLVSRVEKLLNNGADPSSMVCITFTTMAAQEMRSRLNYIPGFSKMFVGTIHSFAYKILREAGKRCKLLTDTKEDAMMKYLVKTYGKYLTPEVYDQWCKYRYLVRCGKMKSYEMKGCLTEDQEAERMILADDKDVTYLFKNKNSYNKDELAYKILVEEKVASTSKDYPETVKSLALKNNYITFNALLEECKTLLENKKMRIQYLFVDEFQDVGIFEYRFLLGLNAENVFVVGDDYQCQPEGTKVTMFNGEEKFIEDIQIGDPVITYHNSQYLKYTPHFKETYAARVQDISVHKVTQLHEITVNEYYKSRYTYNHKCYTSIHLEGNENSFLSYIIQNDKGWYRVGICETFYGGKNKKFHFPVVMQREKACKGWILGFHKDRKNAKLAVLSVIRNFNLPKLSWIPRTDKDNTKLIESTYTNTGDITLQVAQCLKMFGRSIEYPYRYGGDDRHFTHRWMFITQACNIIPGLMDMYIPDETKHKRYSVTGNKIIRGDFTVYGLDVSKYHNYIADKILTHNSIYGFKGADFEYFKAISESPNFKTYKLTNNYRCSSKIVKYSNSVIDKIDDVIPKKCQSKSGITGGSIIKEEGGARVVMKYVSLIDRRDYGRWFILTRSNNDLCDVTRIFDRNNIPYVSFKQGNLNADELQNALKDNVIKVLTIHSSKGLESDNVIMYGNFPDAEDISEMFIDDKGTEYIRIMYVGITRAKSNLVIVNHKGIYNN